MDNLISFVNEFLSYIIVFAVFISVMLVSGFIGTSIRKSKNAKEAETEANQA